MSTRTRTMRRKLKAHDHGQNRHNRGMSLILKQSRQAQERAA